jgi:hypothetical protein
LLDAELRSGFDANSALSSDFVTTARPVYIARLIGIDFHPLVLFFHRDTTMKEGFTEVICAPVMMTVELPLRAVCNVSGLQRCIRNTGSGIYE